MATRTSHESGIKIGSGRRGVTIRSRAVLVIVMAMALCASMAVVAASASATKGVVSFYGGHGTKGGQFGYLPQTGGSLAINQDGVGGATAGDFYVSDPTNNRIQVFTESGTFVRAFGLNVGGSGSNVCTVAADCVAGTASGAAGALSSPEGLAIDQSNGNVFVTDYGNRRVDVFSAMGVFEGAFGWNVKAVGSAEELQFCDTTSGCQAGSEGSGAGQFARFQNGGAIGGIAISPLNGHILVTSVANHRVDEFAPVMAGATVSGVSFVRGFGWGAVNGAAEFQICTSVCHAPYVGAGEGQPGYFVESTGVAVGNDGTIYVADKRVPRIQRFAPDGSLLSPFVEISETPGITDGFEDVTFDSSTNRVHLFSYGGHHRGFEYDLAGSLLESFSIGEIFFAQGQAVNEATGTTYLFGNVFGEGIDQGGIIKIGDPVPPTASIGVVSPGGTTATFNGTVNPQGFFTRVHFEYSTNGHDWTALPDKELPGDSSDHQVSQTATGLEAHTPYGLRLVAVKASNGGTGSAESTFTTGAAPPVASATTAANISTGSATLTGTINPENEATTYRFQCVTQSAYETSEWQTAVDVPQGGAEVPAVGEDVSVSQPISGLIPLTRYRCRLVASNLTGGVIGGDVSFVTYATQGAGLPDGRVYEQATPVEKNGSSASGEKYLVKAARSGQAITYFISGGGSTGEGSQDFPTYVASREGGNWVSHGLLPASSYGDRAEVKGWSEDMARDYPLVWSSGKTATFYMRENATGAMQQIATGLAPYTGAAFAAESADGSEVMFESSTALVSGAKNGVPNLYLWSRATGGLTLVDVLPTGAASLTGGFAGSYSWAKANLKIGGAESQQYTQYLNVLSEDGSTAFFTTANVGQLYARRNLTGPAADTVQVSESHKTNGVGPGGKDPQGSKPAAFMEATPDGHYVFFTSQSELTNDATTGEFNSQEVPVVVENKTQKELEANPLGGEFTLELGGAKTASLPWTAGAAEVEAQLEALPAIGAGNVRVRALSSRNSAPYLGEEISHRYVVSFIGALAKASQPTLIVGGNGVNGVSFGAARQLADAGNDLYRYDVRTGELVDIAPDQTDPAGAEVQAVLGSSDDGSDVYFIANGVLAEGATSGNCKAGPATGIVESGRNPCNIYLWHEGSIQYVAPISTEFEAEIANWSPASDLGGGKAQRTGQVEGNTLIFASVKRLTGYDNGGFTEIYRYNPADGLLCVSCIPSGQSPPLAGASMAGVQSNFGAPIAPNPFLLRNITDGGRRVFFDSQEQLLATDVNHVRDVYEWEASGTGSCTGTAQNGGCLYLISSGTSPEPSYFADAGSSGEDVFFFTKQQLVGQDTDELQDVYDAKVGGGIEAQNPLPVVPCSGEACRGTSPGAPEPASAGTSRYVGPGNPKVPSACKKGFVRKGGKCVKKKHHKKKHKQGKRSGKHGGGKNKHKKQQAKGGTNR